jgi:signal transduction histidine kinase
LKHALSAADRARDLAKQILTFSRQRDEGKALAPIQPIINDTLKMMHGYLPATIEVAVQMPEKAPLVEINATQMHQVLMNLCLNAFQAMKEQGGRLEVRLEMPPETARDAAPRPGKGWMRIVVRDNGDGMDGETMARLFEPFFTTKGPDQGTGLGLSVSRRIIEDHGGRIEVESTLGHGSTFTIFLPIPEQKPAGSMAMVSESNREAVTVSEEKPGDPT